MIASLAVLAALTLVGATTASFSRDWRLALLAHFRPHLAAGSLLGAIVILFVALPFLLKLLLLWALVAVAAVNVWEVFRSTREGKKEAGGQRLRLAFANVLVTNLDHRRVIDWVREEKPDVFVATEVLRRWPAALAVLEDEFPYVVRSRIGDVAIFSRHPFDGEPQHLFAEIGHAAAVRINGVTLVGVHTATPEEFNHSRACDELIGMVGDLVRIASGPIVVAGDFNATPWSRPIVKLVAETGLAFGPGARLGTFPAELSGLKLPAWFALPIDMVLAGHGAAVIACRHGPRVGSDHWPVIAEICYGDRGDFKDDSRSAPVSASSALKASVSDPDSSHSA